MELHKITQHEWNLFRSNYPRNKEGSCNNKHYNAKNNITGTPPFDNPSIDTTNWEQIDMSDEFGDTIQYSEWTDDKFKE